MLEEYVKKVGTLQLQPCRWLTVLPAAFHLPFPASDTVMGCTHISNLPSSLLTQRVALLLIFRVACFYFTILWYNFGPFSFHFASNTATFNKNSWNKKQQNFCPLFTLLVLILNTRTHVRPRMRLERQRGERVVQAGHRTGNDLAFQLQAVHETTFENACQI